MKGRRRQHKPQDNRWTQPASGTNPSAWDTPDENPPLTAEELKVRESQLRVDMVQDMVPFWIRGVEAAERGDELKMETFLDEWQTRMDTWMNGENSWGTANDDNGWGTSWDIGGHDGWDWGGPVNNGWGEDALGWGGAPPEQRGLQAERKDAWSVSGDSSALVEDVAKERGLSPAEKKRMYSFYKLPTDDKVQKINEVIAALRTSTKLDAMTHHDIES
ncbi:hypothetical protein BDN72DRAFT_33722 [Pluteus cervinus]|uniref:Uncharacterized protein n=1 Tax=Pluteus cervinus TaxID=181527 RepID=A0ACD3BHU1_9AGAR|nr:hypothetical protein BDN72DRAFT_33722 [Pluteus cervinus]